MDFSDDLANFCRGQDTTGEEVFDQLDIVDANKLDQIVVNLVLVPIKHFLYDFVFGWKGLNEPVHRLLVYLKFGLDFDQIVAPIDICEHAFLGIVADWRYKTGLG